MMSAPGRTSNSKPATLSELLSKIRVKAVKRDKMFPMKQKVLGLNASLLSTTWKRLISLSFGKIKGLRNRTRIITHFVDVILLMNQKNGPLITCK